MNGGSGHSVPIEHHFDERVEGLRREFDARFIRIEEKLDEAAKTPWTTVFAIAGFVVTVAIPTIGPRAIGSAPPGQSLLERACRSVRDQTLPALGGIAVALDADHLGAASTRQRALDMVETDFTAFLDDDDFFYDHY